MSVKCPLRRKQLILLNLQNLKMYQITFDYPPNCLEGQFTLYPEELLSI